MKVYDIQWDIDIEEALEVLDQKTCVTASKILEISEERYSNMTTSERHDYAYSYFHHCPGAMEDFIGLPNSVEIPINITDEDDISDWLSDEYGFCHNGFKLEADIKQWRIPVTWEVCAMITVEASTLEEAMEIARDEDGEIPCPTDNDYVDGSWRLSTEDKNIIMDCYNRQIST